MRSAARSPARAPRSNPPAHSAALTGKSDRPRSPGRRGTMIARIELDITKLGAPKPMNPGIVATRSAGRRRLLALLPVLGLSLAASGCIASPSYGVRSYYDDPYADARGSGYGAGPYYSSQRTVIVHPRRVIVRQPTYRHHRADRGIRSDHRHRAEREHRGSRGSRAVRPASRPHRAVRPHEVRNAPRDIDHKDSRRHPSRPFVRDHDRQSSEARAVDRRPDRRQVRDREHSRDGERTRRDEQRRQRQGRGRD